MFSAFFRAPAILLATFLEHVMAPRRTYEYCAMFAERDAGHAGAGEVEGAFYHNRESRGSYIGSVAGS